MIQRSLSKRRHTQSSPSSASRQRRNFAFFVRTKRIWIRESCSWLTRAQSKRPWFRCLKNKYAQLTMRKITWASKTVNCSWARIHRQRLSTLIASVPSLTTSVKKYLGYSRRSSKWERLKSKARNECNSCSQASFAPSATMYARSYRCRQSALSPSIRLISWPTKRPSCRNTWSGS